MTWTMFFFIIMSLTSVWWIDHRLSGPLKQWAELQVRNIGQRAITAAIQTTVATNSQTPNVQFVQQFSDTIDGTAAWQYDWAALHALDAALTDEMLNHLEALKEEHIAVPLGQLLGINILAGAGPSLPVRIAPAGAVTTDVQFTFTSVGINQVLHEIAMHIDLTMRVIAPLVSEEIRVTQRVPLSTVILQGRVPEVFINWGSGSFQEFLDSGMDKQLTRSTTT